MINMTKSGLKISAVVLSLLAFGGCAAPELTPAAARGDKYTADHVVFSGQDDLVDHVAIGNIVRTFDSSGILHVTIPARATTPDDLYVDYRLTYFDENHNPIDTPTAWQTFTLHSNIFEYIQANASTPAARDFQLDVRSAQ
jgi:hypothetical protein